MSTRELNNETPIPADRLAEAGVWIARLHGDDRDPALEAGFRQWLKAHPLNARAFELTTEVWEDSQNLRRVVPFAHQVAPAAAQRRTRLSSSMIVAVAAAAIVVVISALLYFPRGVVTGVGEQRQLVLADGTRVFLNTATRALVHYDKDARHVELKYGEALFDVAKRPNWPFIVQVGDRQVTALGTSFIVRREDDRIAVTLVEGKVAVTPVRSGQAPQLPAIAAPGTGPDDATDDSSAGAGEAITLTPGQRLMIAVDMPAQIDMPSLDQAIAWRRGQVVLDDTPLATAIAEMNRYSAIKLSIERPEAARVLVNGLFQAGDSMSFANAIAHTYGLRVVERRNEITLVGTPQPGTQEHR
jgi:transmembrane sensor